MNLWVSSLLLVGLSLVSSEPTEEECKALITPHTTFRPMYGRWTFIMGWSDNPVFSNYYRSTRSQWIDFLPTDDPNVMIEDTGLRHPTYCKFYETSVTIKGNSGISQRSGFTCHFHSLKTCRHCLLYLVRSINNNRLVPATGTPTKQEDLNGYRALYMMATGKTISAADLAQVKKQAWCLGFREEPTFYYNGKHDFCEPDE